MTPCENSSRTGAHNVTRAAELLGTTKPRLYRMIKRHGIRLERAGSQFSGCPETSCEIAAPGSMSVRSRRFRAGQRFQLQWWSAGTRQVQANLSAISLPIDESG